MNIVIISGYFDPITVGHIEYIKLAKKLSDDGKLIVIVNNDNQATLKKGRPFMICKDRISILKELRDVDFVFESVDKDRTVIKTIEKVFSSFSGFNFYFANGGDQFNTNIPEKEICDKLGIKLVDNLGAKIASSSWLTGLGKI